MMFQRSGGFVQQCLLHLHFLYNIFRDDALGSEVLDNLSEKYSKAVAFADVLMAHQAFYVSKRYHLPESDLHVFIKDSPKDDYYDALKHNLKEPDQVIYTWPPKNKPTHCWKMIVRTRFLLEHLFKCVISYKVYVVFQHVKDNKLEGEIVFTMQQFEKLQIRIHNWVNQTYAGFILPTKATEKHLRFMSVLYEDHERCLFTDPGVVIYPHCMEDICTSDSDSYPNLDLIEALIQRPETRDPEIRHDDCTCLNALQSE